MFYLLDAVCFLGFFALLLIFGLAVSSPQRSILHALVFAPIGFLGLWATLFYVAGTLGLLLPALFWGAALLVLVGGTLWKRSQLAANFRRLSQSFSTFSLLDRVLCAYVVAVAALLFVLSLVPPSSADYDSLVYHLAVPAQWLRAGRISQLAYDHHSYFPFVGEMLYALALGVRDAVFAKLFHWSMLVWGALSLCALGRLAGGRTAGLWAAALLVSLPMAQSEAMTAYIDLTFSTFAWASIMLFCEALFHNLDERTRRLNWLASGLFCGLCLGSKYFGWLIFGFLGLWALVASLRARRTNGDSAGGDHWLRLVWLALPALALGGFWYARNVAWTGNPVFPFAYSIFGGRGWTTQMATAYDADQASFGFGKTPFDLLVLPFRLAMAPVNAKAPYWPLITSLFQDPKHSGLFEVPGLFLYIFIGPTLLALGVPTLLARRKGALVGFLAWLFAFLWVFWAVSSQQIRYLFPALGVLCVLSGWMLATRLPRFPIASRIAGICLGLWMVFSPLLSATQASSSRAVLLGVQTPDDYLRRSFAGYVAMQWIGDNTPPTSRIAVYGEPRDFYLPRSYFWADDAHNNLIPYDTITTPVQLVDALKQQRATYVLVNHTPETNGGAFGPPQPLFERAVASGALSSLFSTRSGFEVYRLN